MWHTDPGANACARAVTADRICIVLSVTPMIFVARSADEISPF
jgi:hypothetical protein